jgi:tRNA A-37 threonylcarbamoyl transferase component Bud32
VSSAAPTAGSEPHVHRSRRAVLYVNPGYGGRLAVDDIFDLPEAVRGLRGASTRLPGRPTAWLWAPPWHDGPGLRVRQYAHGGALAPMSRTRFLRSARMLHEFRLASRAVAAGVQTACPVALLICRRRPLVQAYYVSENIPGALNLLELCAAVPADPLTASGRRGLAEAVAAAVAGMHDAGIVHADLNLKNVLVRCDPDGPSAFVVDFDKARHSPTVSLQRRMGNLARLDRSVVKWQASREAISLSDRLRVLRSYLARYPQWREHWPAIATHYVPRGRRRGQAT